MVGTLWQREEWEGVEKTRTWHTLEAMPQEGRRGEEQKECLNKEVKNCFKEIGKLEAELEPLPRFLAHGPKTFGIYDRKEAKKANFWFLVQHLRSLEVVPSIHTTRIEC